ncbi:esterase/lipase family protein [Colwellia chukchiensis]|nr:alpha/beta hydrolase [Colwellia chukchiensis]
MTRLISTFFLLTTCLILVGCTTSRFAKLQSASVNIVQANDPAQLPVLITFNTLELESYCRTLPATTDFGIVALLQCANELLSRADLSAQQRDFALSAYNRNLTLLVKAEHAGRLAKDRVLIHYENLVPFSFVDDIVALDKRLTPAITGEIGLAITTSRDNTQTGLDIYFPLEGVKQSATILLKNITLQQEKTLRISVEIKASNDNNVINLGDNKYQIRHSPAAAYLDLLEQANIDDYNWLGMVSPTQAEKRRGVFVIGNISQHKIPIIMIHGLNSDPLIWRHLTMAILNNPALVANYQIWHIYYPSGPPPFYSAARTRDNLQQLLKTIDSPRLAKKAVIIGHSMGGVVANLLSTRADHQLWDATFKLRPEQMDSVEPAVKDIFIYQAVFASNTVFFLDTPFKGSEVASSVIGKLGAFLVTLPTEFTKIFQNFFARTGVHILTDKMRPFLINYGPSSIHVLRPGHPLMETLYDLPIQGESYAIIGSDGALSCQDELTCSSISDGVVNYTSANYLHAKERLIVSSAHNSFQNEQAIAFILNKLNVAQDDTE